MKDPNQIRLLVAFRTSTRSDHRLTFSGLWGFFEPRVGGQSINCSRSPCAANTPVNQVSSFLPWKVPEGSSAWKHSELTWEDGQPTLLKKNRRTAPDSESDSWTMAFTGFHAMLHGLHTYSPFFSLFLTGVQLQSLENTVNWRVIASQKDCHRPGSRKNKCWFTWAPCVAAPLIHADASASKPELTTPLFFAVPG